MYHKNVWCSEQKCARAMMKIYLRWKMCWLNWLHFILSCGLRKIKTSGSRYNFFFFFTRCLVYLEIRIQMIWFCAATSTNKMESTQHFFFLQYMGHWCQNAAFMYAWEFWLSLVKVVTFLLVISQLFLSSLCNFTPWLFRPFFSSSHS